LLYIGLDDTDSHAGMCTTYIGAKLVTALAAFGPVDEPMLIRLNPTIPHKTRGNGAVSIRINTDRADDTWDVVTGMVESLADLSGKNTNPGAVMLDHVTSELGDYSLRAVREVIPREDADSLLERFALRYSGYNNGRGLIGALAAAGSWDWKNRDGWDWTWERLAYRTPDRWGTRRVVDPARAFQADAATYPRTWDTVDIANRDVVCTPGGPDPVLYGVRGESRQAVEDAAGMLETETAELAVTYRTNQGTDMHVVDAKLSGVADWRSYRLRGEVGTRPHHIRGGHVFFELCDDGAVLECAAFEPTKQFRAMVRRLIPGDVVECCGSVLNQTLNLEKIRIIELADDVKKVNPECPSCHRRMESAGRGQGYRCRRCRTTAGAPVLKSVERDLAAGAYEVPPCARRHLAMPLARVRGAEYPVFPAR